MRFISYLRCSTKQQRSSNLGIEAQRESVGRYLKGLGEAVLIEEFVEVESGTKADRPILQEALRECKKHNAVLLVAKIDRLARSVSFISGLTDKKVPFIAVDNPHCDEFTIHLFSAFAQREAKLISERTTAALAAAKARGVELGKHGKVLAKENKDKADSFAKSMFDVLKEAAIETSKKYNRTSYRLISDFLTKKKHKTKSGGHKWHPQTVKRMCDRLGFDINSKTMI